MANTIDSVTEWMIPEAHTQHMQWYQQLVWSLAEIEHRIYVESYPEMDEQSRSSLVSGAELFLAQLFLLPADMAIGQMAEVGKIVICSKQAL